MKKIGIFLHVYQIGSWETIYVEQILRLQRSGLYDSADYIFIGVNGNQPMPFTLNKVDRQFVNKNLDVESEYCTMKALYDYSNLVNDAHVLFLHSKGVTWSIPEIFHEDALTPNGYLNRKVIFENTQRWRNYLEYFLIDNWKTCVNLLDNHDTVGTEWQTKSYIGRHTYDKPHYGGCMWWANSSYIRKLEPNFITNNLAIGRFANELWIGTEKPNYYNFFTSHRNLYSHPILEEEYTSIIANMSENK